MKGQKFQLAWISVSFHFSLSRRPLHLLQEFYSCAQVIVLKEVLDGAEGVVEEGLDDDKDDYDDGDSGDDENDDDDDDDLPPSCDARA